MKLDYVVHAGWPPLAWLAVCRPGTKAVAVHHGTQVETAARYFCEAVWDGPFEAGDFDQTDIVAGSGGRLRDAACTFVSSGTTVDRLHSATRKGVICVSNSLACLLAAFGEDVDVTYTRYFQDFRTVIQGLEGYKRCVACSGGPVELTYFRNLRWDTSTLQLEDKPLERRDFGSYSSYYAFLTQCMRAIASNAQARTRRVRYPLLGTLSSGYDSAAVAALAQEAGCEAVICFDCTTQGLDDSGVELAKRLGIEPVPIAIDAWRALDMPEVSFVAANSMGEETRFAAARNALSSKVLLTGYHGDKMWAKEVKDLSPNIVRGDPSGLGLSEFRLWAGFIHCVPPFWGVRQIADVNRLSRAPELADWDVPGDYSRPICRRIVEERGVPRRLFGVHKRMASTHVHNYSELLSTSSRADFMDWLRGSRARWLRARRVPPIPSIGLDTVLHQAAGWLETATRPIPGLWRLGARWSGLPTYLRRHVFPRAIDRAKQRYATSARIL